MHDIAVVRAVAAMDAADAGGEQLLVTLGKVLMTEARPRQQPGEFDLVVLGVRSGGSGFGMSGMASVRGGVGGDRVGTRLSV